MDMSSDIQKLGVREKRGEKTIGKEAEEEEAEEEEKKMKRRGRRKRGRGGRGGGMEEEVRRKWIAKSQ